MAKKTKPAKRSRATDVKHLRKVVADLPQVRTPLPPAQGLPKAPQLEPSRSLLPKNEF